MNILRFLEQHVSISKIILLPVLIGIIPNLIYVLFFPNVVETSAILVFFGLFICGFTGLLITYYKKVPGKTLEPKHAIFVGIFITVMVWLNLLLFVIDYYLK